MGHDPKIPGIGDIAAKPPPDWPWALPHLYLVETVPEPGIDVIGYSAHRDGTGEAKIENVDQRTRVIIVGYWNGVYAVVWSKIFLKQADAVNEAGIHFKIKPIRFWADDGTIIHVNESVRITGQWPDTWTFNRFWDLGAFCAFLYSELGAAGHSQEAEAFKASLHYAMPGTEASIMFHKALKNGRKLFGQWLDPAARMALDSAIETCARRIPLFDPDDR